MGTAKSLNDRVKLPILTLRLTFTVLLVEAVWPALSVELKRTTYCPFKRTVGSKVPSVPFVTGAAPEANVVKVVGLPLPSSSEDSSFQVPAVPEPLTGVG